jgi:hypothetical protein
MILLLFIKNYGFKTQFKNTKFMTYYLLLNVYFINFKYNFISKYRIMI